MPDKDEKEKTAAIVKGQPTALSPKERALFPKDSEIGEPNIAKPDLSGFSKDELGKLNIAVRTHKKEITRLFGEKKYKEVSEALQTQLSLRLFINTRETKNTDVKKALDALFPQELDLLAAFYRGFKLESLTIENLKGLQVAIRLHSKEITLLVGKTAYDNITIALEEEFNRELGALSPKEHDLLTADDLENELTKSKYGGFKVTEIIINLRAHEKEITRLVGKEKYQNVIAAVEIKLNQEVSARRPEKPFNLGITFLNTLSKQELDLLTADDPKLFLDKLTPQDYGKLYATVHTHRTEIEQLFKFNPQANTALQELKNRTNQEIKEAIHKLSDNERKILIASDPKSILGSLDTQSLGELNIAIRAHSKKITDLFGEIVYQNINKAFVEQYQKNYIDTVKNNFTDDSFDKDLFKSLLESDNPKFILESLKIEDIVKLNLVVTEYPELIYFDEEIGLYDQEKLRNITQNISDALAYPERLAALSDTEIRLLTATDPKSTLKNEHHFYNITQSTINVRTHEKEITHIFGEKAYKDLREAVENKLNETVDLGRSDDQQGKNLGTRSLNALSKQEIDLLTSDNPKSFLKNLTDQDLGKLYAAIYIHGGRIDKKGEMGSRGEIARLSFRLNPNTVQALQELQNKTKPNIKKEIHALSDNELKLLTAFDPKSILANLKTEDFIKLTNDIRTNHKKIIRVFGEEAYQDINRAVIAQHQKNHIINTARNNFSSTNNSENENFLKLLFESADLKSTLESFNIEDLGKLALVVDNQKIILDANPKLREDYPKLALYEDDNKYWQNISQNISDALLSKLSKSADPKMLTSLSDKALQLFTETSPKSIFANLTMEDCKKLASDVHADEKKIIHIFGEEKYKNIGEAFIVQAKTYKSNSTWANLKNRATHIFSIKKLPKESTPQQPLTGKTQIPNEAPPPPPRPVFPEKLKDNPSKEPETTWKKNEKTDSSNPKTTPYQSKFGTFHGIGAHRTTEEKKEEGPSSTPTEPQSRSAFGK